MNDETLRKVKESPEYLALDGEEKEAADELLKIVAKGDMPIAKVAETLLLVVIMTALQKDESVTDLVELDWDLSKASGAVQMRAKGMPSLQFTLSISSGVDVSQMNLEDIFDKMAQDILNGGTDG